MHSLYGEQLLLPQRRRFQEGQGCPAPGSPGPSEEPGRTWRRAGSGRPVREWPLLTVGWSRHCHLAWVLGVLTFVKKLVSSWEPKIRYPARLTGSRTGTVSIAAPREEATSPSVGVQRSPRGGGPSSAELQDPCLHSSTKSPCSDGRRRSPLAARPLFPYRDKRSPTRHPPPDTHICGQHQPHLCPEEFRAQLHTAGE